MGGTGRRNSPKLDWPFAQQCARAQNLDDVCDLLQLELSRLGFRYFACCTHTRPDRAAPGAVYLHNYPEPWISLYRRRRFFLRDPVFQIGRDLVHPFCWDDPHFRAMIEPDQEAILLEAAAHGLTPGVTIPLHGPRNASASCSLIPENGVVDADRVHAAARISLYGYETARGIAQPEDRRPRLWLPRRERECMELVALGKDDETIAQILGIEPATVRNYVDSAKHRLGATKRTHAVTLAIHRGAIDLANLLG